MANPTAPVVPQPAPGQKPTSAPVVIPPDPKSDSSAPDWEADLQETISALPEQAPNTPQRRPGERPESPAKESSKEPAKPAPAKPDPSKTEPAKPVTQPKPETKAEPSKAEAKSETPAGRKAGLSPDELLSLEAAEGVELPAEFVDDLKKLGAHELRIQSAKIAKVARQQQSELKRLKTELEESKKAKPDPEKESLTNEYSTLKKNFEAAQEELRYSNYLKSAEYQDKFAKPFEKALNVAYKDIEEFNVITEDGQERPATSKDFDRILELPAGEAIKLAKATFGDAAEEVLSYRRKLVGIRKEAQDAVIEAREKGAEREQQRLAETTQKRAMMERTWNQANEAVAEKYRELFGNNPDDPEEDKAMAKGYEFVDRTNNDSNMSLEEKLYRQALVRHRAAALPKFVNRWKKAQARIAELEKQLAEYQASTPETGSKDGTPTPTEPEHETFEAALDRAFS